MNNKWLKEDKNLNSELSSGLDSGKVKEVEIDPEIFAAAHSFIETRAKQLKAVREKKLNLSQAEFSNLLGINTRTLQRWDMGRSKMPRYIELWMELLEERPAIKSWLKRKNRVLGA